MNNNIKDTILTFLEEKSTKYYIITVVLVLCIIIFSKEKKKKILTILSFVLLQILILVYLIIEGRIPDRIINPLVYCYILTNLYILEKEENIKKYLINVLKYNKIITITLVLIIFVMSINIKTNKEITMNLNIGNSMKNYFEEHSDNLYIYDNNFLSEFEFYNKVKYNNYINMSGWTAYTPFYKEKLKKLGVESLKELLFKDNVYLISNKTTNIDDYKNIDLDVNIEKIESVERFNIYRFTR